MKIWKRNAVIATVLLFVCMGIYLNWSYGEEQTADLTSELDAESVLGETTLVINDSDELLAEASEIAASNDSAEQAGTLSGSANEYFASVRLTRQEARDSALELLQEAAAYSEDGSGESVSTAANELQEMVSTALSEAQIEGLVLAKGYADCVAFMSDDVLSLAVAAPEEGLSESDIARLSDIVTSESGYSLSQLKIIEVK